MFLHETDNQEARKNIKKAWEDGDLIGILQGGFDNFMNMLYDRPISFDKFIEYTSKSFDRYIEKVNSEKKLDFISGRLFLELASETSLKLTAEFYFQTPDKQWVLEKKEGLTDHRRFSDWETAPDLIRLREVKKLEFPIDPPAKIGKRPL